MDGGDGIGGKGALPCRHLLNVRRPSRRSRFVLVAALAILVPLVAGEWCRRVSAPFILWRRAAGVIPGR